MAEGEGVLTILVEDTDKSEMANMVGVTDLPVTVHLRIRRRRWRDGWKLVSASITQGGG